LSDDNRESGAPPESMQPHEPEFVEANRPARTVALFSIAALLSIVAAIRWLLLPLMLAPSSAGLEVQVERSLMAVRVATTVSAVLILPLASFFVWIGAVALRARVWPPPGMPVLWRVRLRRGRYAVGMGIGCLVLGCLYLLHVALHLYAGWFIAGRAFDLLHTHSAVY